MIEIGMFLQHQFDGAGTARTPAAPGAGEFFHDGFASYGEFRINCRDGAVALGNIGINGAAADFYNLHRERNADGRGGSGKRGLDVSGCAGGTDERRPSWQG